MFKELYKAQIGPHAQGVAPAWPAPQAQVGVDAVVEEEEMRAGASPDYLGGLPMAARKSFTDFCAENPTIVAAYQESKLIKSMIDAMGLVFYKFEESVSDALSGYADNVDGFVKSFGEALENLKDFVDAGNQKIESITKSMSGSSQLMKSAGGQISYIPSPYEESSSHSDVLSKIEDLIKSGLAKDSDMLKFETTGEVTNPHIIKALRGA